MQTPLLQNDATVLGLLAVLLGAVFYTSHSQNRYFKAFYKYVPALLLCYFLPSLFNSAGIISGEHSKLYFVASRYLLPACLVLLCMSIDFKAILGLGPKAVTMFLVGTLGIVLGGPFALMVMGLFDPQDVGGGDGSDAVWRGMTTIAGSWIGGGANQAAMKEVYGVGDGIFSVMVTVDVIVANIWMAVLLYMASKADEIDAKTGADTRGIQLLRKKVEAFEAEHARIPSMNDLMLIVAVAFGATGLSHWVADVVTPWMVQNVPWGERYSLHSDFFWMIVTATTIGLGLSFTRARKLEGAGASKVASAFLYILVATIGMKMDVLAIADTPVYFVIGGIWMAFHAALMLIVARLIKAPLFYMAVGSQANVGGAASAPVVASAFHPSLAPVGVLLAVLGYALGTYMAWLCGQLMHFVSL
ncbi:MAG: DUF819 family protein [Pseudomonadota bacterium]|uniref:DUF819 family protein n=1 Tax=Gallaecimonas pentaromativorans TaxID=584787 RepID=UPI00067E794D|nr:DUF819 family protein [Gallaecimonas pentaromativorans]MED5524543.1 DUF819 family protein [Pseudomonadota bacterium]